VLERFKEIGGAISAAATVLATVLAVVKWVQNAGQELPPTLLSLGILAMGIFFVGLGLVGGWFAIRHRSRELGAYAAYFLLMSALLAWIVTYVELFATLSSGEYRAHRGTLIVVGATTWTAAVILLLMTAHARLVRRKAPDWAPRGHKPCPECAEFPKRAARVCRHCGHRFAVPVVLGEP
jgi:hypothetical protein